MKATKGKGAVKKDKNEVLKPVEDRVVGKRKAALKASKSSSKPAKKVKPAKKDPNKPKRPPTAFFVFLEEFRKVYKQQHPNVKAVSAVGKAGGEKWKSLTDALVEKAPYEAKASKRKLDYEKLMTAYNKKQKITDDEDEEKPEKSKSKARDDDDGLEEEDEEEEEEEDDDEDEDEE